MTARNNLWMYLNTHDEKEIDRTTIIQLWNMADKELLAQLAGRCDKCGARIVNDCQRCGAPQCCPQCCEIDALRDQLAAVTAERNRFADHLSALGYKPRCTCTMDDNMHEPSCDITEWARIRFARMAPLDWRIDDETPYGQMLDGLGDDV